MATREITSTAILFRLLVTYQPGGTGEKQLLLKQLSEVNSQSKSTSDQLVNSLRVWRRAYQRAREIDTSLPDSVLLLKALETVTVRIAALDTQASYRLSSSRAQLQLDEKPTHMAIWQYSECLMAEAESLMLLQGTKAVNGENAAVKVQQLETPQRTTPPPGDGKGKGGKTTSSPGKKGGGDSKLCRRFASEAGCRAGKGATTSMTWRR